MRHLIRVMNGHDLTNKKTMTKTYKKTKTERNTFREQIKKTKTLTKINTLRAPSKSDPSDL